MTKERMLCDAVNQRRILRITSPSSATEAAVSNWRMCLVILRFSVLSPPEPLALSPETPTVSAPRPPSTALESVAARDITSICGRRRSVWWPPRKLFDKFIGRGGPPVQRQALRMHFGGWAALSRHWRSECSISNQIPSRRHSWPLLQPRCLAR